MSPIDILTKKVADLERTSIQVQMDPTTVLYLQTAISAALLGFPTQTYSLSGPTGSAITGSLWMEDTGVLATRKIYVYSGSAWIQMK